MKQTRRASLIESVANVIIGYGVALGSQVVVFPIYGLHVGFKDNLKIGIVFTVVSLVRSFILRRVFEILRMRRMLP